MSMVEFVNITTGRLAGCNHMNAFGLRLRIEVQTSGQLRSTKRYKWRDAVVHGHRNRQIGAEREREGEPFDACKGKSLLAKLGGLFSSFAYNEVGNLFFLLHREFSNLMKKANKKEGVPSSEKRSPEN
ncbi:hypothetical protein RUM43_011447 [Polyplax serrata]|uniref:Uncharacterized protein n=1 Tax=Polyplax serrata TaxID=468196 RepID=A0AAN8P7J8_POLSC